MFQKSDFFCIDESGNLIDSSHLDNSDDDGDNDVKKILNQESETTQTIVHTDDTSAESPSTSIDPSVESPQQPDGTTTEEDENKNAGDTAAMTHGETHETPAAPSEQGGSPSSSWLGSSVTGWLSLGKEEQPGTLAEGEKKDEQEKTQAEASLTSSVTGWLGFGGKGKPDDAVNNRDEDKETAASFTSTMTGWLGFGGEKQSDPTKKEQHEEKETDDESEPKETFRSRRMSLDLEGSQLQEEEKDTGTLAWLGNGLSSTIGFGMTKQESEPINEEKEKPASSSWLDIGVGDILGFGKYKSEVDDSTRTGFKEAEKDATLEQVSTSENADISQSQPAQTEEEKIEPDIQILEENVGMETIPEVGLHTNKSNVEEHDRFPQSKTDSATLAPEDDFDNNNRDAYDGSKGSILSVDSAARVDQKNISFQTMLEEKSQAVGGMSSVTDEERSVESEGEEHEMHKPIGNEGEDNNREPGEEEIKTASDNDKDFLTQSDTDLGSDIYSVDSKAQSVVNIKEGDKDQLQSKTAECLEEVTNQFGNAEESAVMSLESGANNDDHEGERSNSDVLHIGIYTTLMDESAEESQVNGNAEESRGTSQSSLTSDTAMEGNKPTHSDDDNVTARSVTTDPDNLDTVAMIDDRNTDREPHHGEIVQDGEAHTVKSSSQEFESSHSDNKSIKSLYGNASEDQTLTVTQNSTVHDSGSLETEEVEVLKEEEKHEELKEVEETKEEDRQQTVEEGKQEVDEIKEEVYELQKKEKQKDVKELKEEDRNELKEEQKQEEIEELKKEEKQEEVYNLKGEKMQEEIGEEEREKENQEVEELKEEKKGEQVVEVTEEEKQEGLGEVEKDDKKEGVQELKEEKKHDEVEGLVGGEKGEQVREVKQDKTKKAQVEEKQAKVEEFEEEKKHEEEVKQQKIPGLKEEEKRAEMEELKEEKKQEEVQILKEEEQREVLKEANRLKATEKEEGEEKQVQVPHLEVQKKNTHDIGKPESESSEETHDEVAKTEEEKREEEKTKNENVEQAEGMQHVDDVEGERRDREEKESLKCSNKHCHEAPEGESVIDTNENISGEGPGSTDKATIHRRKQNDQMLADRTGASKTIPSEGTERKRLREEEKEKTLNDSEADEGDKIMLNASWHEDIYGNDANMSDHNGLEVEQIGATSYTDNDQHPASENGHAGLPNDMDQTAETKEQDHLAKGADLSDHDTLSQGHKGLKLEGSETSSNRIFSDKINSEHKMESLSSASDSGESHTEQTVPHMFQDPVGSSVPSGDHNRDVVGENESAGAFGLFKNAFSFFSQTKDTTELAQSFDTNTAESSQSQASLTPEQEPDSITDSSQVSVEDRHNDSPISIPTQAPHSTEVHSHLYTPSPSTETPLQTKNLSKHYKNLLSHVSPDELTILMDFFGRHKLQFLDYILGSSETVTDDPENDGSILLDIERLLHHHRETLVASDMRLTHAPQENKEKARALIAFEKLEMLFKKLRETFNTSKSDITKVNRQGIFVYIASTMIASAAGSFDLF